MARKPCAQDVEKFIVDPKYCGCKEQSGRFSRIARNAILPFYYNCPPGADLNNKNKTCEKVFYIKNPKYFAGGDMVIGSSLAVHAIAHGRDAAQEIIRFLAS